MARRGVVLPLAALGLPRDWIAAPSGELIAAVQLALVGGEPPSGAALAQAFGGHNVVGGTAAGGQAKVWTDFYPDADNCVRVVVHGGAMSARQAGRLVQRLLEIETYTMMALWPCRWRASFRLR